MTRSFIDHTLETAPAAARVALTETKQKFGKIPSPIARLAASPLALPAVLTGLETFEHSSLTPLEREVLAMTMGRKNDCHYCVNLHRRLLRLIDAPPAVCEALEHGTPLAIPKLEALRTFILSALEHTGNVPAPVWAQFLGAGFDHANALEVIVGISAYTLTTFANRLTEAPLD